jgi:hypothetical protein
MIKNILKFIWIICVLPLDMALIIWWVRFLEFNSPIFTFEPLAVFCWTLHWILFFLVFFIVPVVLTAFISDL